MLPLDSSRWTAFSTFFDSPEQMPQRLTSWRDAIGGPDEASQWADLQEQFLHQFTITDAAYAVLPYLVEELARLTPEKAFEYLVSVALVEAARQQPEAPALPPDLADAYHAAIVRARRLAMESLSLDWSKAEFRYLLSALSSLHGHGVMGELLFHLDCICGTCPNCGTSVYPEEIPKSGY